MSNLKDKEKENQMNKIESNIIDYYCNSIDVDQFVSQLKLNDDDTEKIGEILADGLREWDEIQVDNDGATEEQDTLLDNNIDSVTNAILLLQLGGE